MTIVFENTDTMRWQVQEMARAERMLRDEQIAHEVETYNQLIPDAGELSATLFIELTSDAGAARVAAASSSASSTTSRSCCPTARRVVGAPSEATRSGSRATTSPRPCTSCSSAFAPPSRSTMFASGPVHIVVDHPEYDHDVALDAEQHAELLADLARSST